jgi:hypothetical protein
MRIKMTSIVCDVSRNGSNRLMCAEIKTGGTDYHGTRMPFGKSKPGFSVPFHFTCTKKRYIRQNVKYTLQFETLNMLKGPDRILDSSNHMKKGENI